MDLEGSRLGKYELHAEIGRGGMGVVYRGYDPDLARAVAVKVLTSQPAREEKSVERFMREARAAAQLSHAHIVVIHDVGEHNGQYYFVMEYLEGRPLSQVLREQGRFSSDETLFILRQLADALDYAHARGLVHRDVKPSNVLVDRRGQAKLTDFGLVLAAQASRLTVTGTMMGTPHYMSPEQARGETVGPPGDLYSLAVMAYELMSGVPPFDADSTPAIIHMQVYEPPPPIVARCPDLPRSVDEVFQHALAKEPGKRYHSCTAFVTALAQALQGQSRHATAPTPPAQAAVETSHVRSASPPARSIPWVWLVGGAAIAILLLVGSLAISAAISRPEPTPTMPIAVGSTEVAVQTLVEELFDTNTPNPEPTRTPMPTLTTAPTLEPTRTPEPTWTRAPTPPPIVNLTALTHVSASDQAPDGVDTCGNAVTYSPGNLTDGQNETAWRVVGDGQNAWIRFDFGREIMLASVQMLPGYSKRDPCDTSIDWCLKNRIPRRVDLQAADGQQIELVLDNECTWQAFDIGPWRTSWLQVTIQDSFPRREEHHTDLTTISEIQLLGWEF